MLSWLAALGNQIEPYWVVILVIAVPVAGAVGFLANIASLKKTRLENKRLADELSRLPKTLEKLELEVEVLKRVNREAAEKTIKEALRVRPADEDEMRRLVANKLEFERATRFDYCRDSARMEERSEWRPPSMRNATSPVSWLLRALLVAVVLIVIIAVVSRYRH